MYGTGKRMPSKRRIAGTPTPGKIRKVGVVGAAVPYYCCILRLFITLIFFYSVQRHRLDSDQLP